MDKYRKVSVKQRKFIQYINDHHNLELSVSEFETVDIVLTGNGEYDEGSVVQKELNDMRDRYLQNYIDNEKNL